ncbi:S9 family peptidase [Niveibacterium terrae]|uniref:S9 family peptidase n=1 Tax=Niveibacterium terrae TaxID=3373598 RepID=UPI003A933841
MSSPRFPARALLVLAGVIALLSADLRAEELQAPVAARKPYQVQSPNGAREDPYYWLRDDSRQSPEVLDYLKAENAYTQAQLAPGKALQDTLYAEMVGRIKQDDSTVPTRLRGYWYSVRFEKGKEYPIYCRRKAKLAAPEQVMLDGNELAAGKSFFQIGGYAVSPDDKLLAYAEDTVGRRQFVVRFKDLVSGKFFADRLSNVEPDVLWAADSRTLLYIAKDPVTLLSTKVYRHSLGTEQKDDQLVYEEKDHSYYLSFSRSKTGRFLYIEAKSTQQSEWRYALASDRKLKFSVVLSREANHEYQVMDVGGDFVLRTNWKAKNFRIVRVPIVEVARRDRWRDVVAAREDAFIQSFDAFRDFIAVSERSGGLMKLRVKSWDGKQDRLIAADEPSYLMSLGWNPEFSATRIRYDYSSLATPMSTYEYDWSSGARTRLKTQPVPGYDPTKYRTEYLHVTARDGTQVPVSLVYRRDTPRDGSAPLFQYGYGSYGMSMDPAFRSNWVSLADRGFVVAIAHIRGGQEMGRDWYEQGKLLKKQNTFTDFIDVTRSLVAQKYAARDKVFAEGGSAGGLLMGAIANMAPADYRGIIAQVPFVDVVTTMLDESIPLTTNEFDEWGNPKEKVSYDAMLAYSPYDNVKAQAYPAMLVSTGLWDSQVQYYEPAKWVAKLRAMKTDVNPLLFKINMEAGHGGKSGRFERLRETAIEFQFMLDQLGIRG